jgi:hypothetical protein
VRSFLNERGMANSGIGKTGGNSIRIEMSDLDIETICDVPLGDLRAAHEGFFPNLMGADAALA